MALEQPLEDISEVLEQVPAIRHLHGVRRPLLDALRVGLGAVPRDERDCAVLLQPARQRVRSAIGQQVDGCTPFEIDEDRAVGVPAPDRPIVDPHDARGRGRVDLGMMNEPEERVGAALETEGGQEPRGCLAAECGANPCQRR